MAGIAQHHVWRMLQRGFSFTDKGPDQIWVYSKDADPEQTVTKKFGKDYYFYGEPDIGADKNITDYENSVQSFIQGARQSPSGTELNSEVCGALVAHLEMRSSFLRSQIAEVAEAALNQLKEAFSSPVSLQKMMLHSSATIETEIEARLATSNASEADKRVLRALAPLILPSAISEGHAEVSTPIVGALDEFINSIPDLTKNAHINSLVSPFTEVERARIHQKLSFKTYRLENPSLILPDTCLAFLMEGKCSPVSQKSDKVESVVVPISAHVAIIGLAKGAIHPTGATINRVLASCAKEFFISNSKTSELQRLSSRIGKNAVMLSEAEIKKTLSLRSLLESLGQPRST